MAGSSLLALLDDIATILDDVALLSKVAAKKTAAVLGDDLALNAQQVAGVQADRELPVVWAVAKGSLKNKLILVPAALAISAFIPWLITPLLMIGGAYLCYEGFEKIAHRFLHPKQLERAEHLAMIEALADPDIDLVVFEQDKIKGAVRTDFILSAEIIVIALGTVKEANFSTQVAVVAGIALLITIGVYGLVALIVKLDDIGLHLMTDQALNLWAKLKRTVGQGLLAFAPLLMKTLGYLGTLAMFLVGGGILLHGIHVLEPIISTWQTATEQIPSAGTFLAPLVPVLANLVFGMLAGALVLVLVTLVNRLRIREVSQ